MLSLPLLLSFLHRGLPGLREHRLRLLLFHLCPECASATRDQAWLSLGQPRFRLLQNRRGAPAPWWRGQGPDTASSEQETPLVGAGGGSMASTLTPHRFQIPLWPWGGGRRGLQRHWGGGSLLPTLRGPGRAPPAFGAAHGPVDFAASRQPAPEEEGCPGAHPPTAAPGRLSTSHLQQKPLGAW